MFDDLEEAMNKKFGNVIRPADRMLSGNIINTGIFAIDYALQGGLQEGQVHILVGNEQGGKTTNSLKLMKNMLSKYEDEEVGGIYFDIEGTLDELWAEQLGIDLQRMYVADSFDYGEQAVDSIIAACEHPKCRMVVVDSIPALVTRREIEASAIDDHMALRARLVSKLFNGALSRLIKRRRNGNPCTFVCVNQYRTNLGIHYGDNRVMPGGSQQRYAAHSIVEVRPNKKLKTSSDQFGMDAVEEAEFFFKLVKTKGPKNLLSGSYNMVSSTDCDLPLGAVDDYKTVITYGKKHGLVGGAGQNQYIVGVEEKFKNQDMMRKFLIENPDQYIDLKTKIIASRRYMTGLSLLPPDNYLYKYHDEIQLPNMERLEEIKSEGIFGDVETEQEG